MNQVGPKRGQVNGPDVCKQWDGVLVDPRQPRVETGDIMQIGLHRRRCQIARHQMAPEGCEEVCIRIGERCGYYTHKLFSVPGDRFCV